MDDSEPSVKLICGLERTSTRIYVNGAGNLVVDYYDFSEAAQRAFGNDVAYLLTIKAAEKPRILQLLARQADIEAPSLSPDNVLLTGLQQFSDYFSLKRWLEANAIPYQESFDSWA